MLYNAVGPLTNREAVRRSVLFLANRRSTTPCYSSSQASLPKRTYTQITGINSQDTSSTPPLTENKPAPVKAPEASISAQKSRNIVAERSYFDTHQFVKSLTQNGFNEQQAEQLCVLVKEITNYVSGDIKKECVTRSGQDLAIQQVMIHIGSLKKDMIILEKSEFSALRNENEKLMISLKTLKEQMNEELIKLQGGFRLDINLEKSRHTEVNAELSNKIHKLDSRIDTEISNMKAIFEAFKADSIKYLAGTVMSVLVVILGALRLIM